MEKLGGDKQGKLAGLADFLIRGLGPTSIFLALYFLVSIAVRMVMPNALTLDEAEQSLFSQYWLLGYGPQPPFYNWVQNIVVRLMGLSLFSLALPKFAMLLLCYVFYGMAARTLEKSSAFVALAMLSLLALPQLSYMPQQDLTHTVAVLMATSLFLYGLCRVLQRPDWQGYAIIGIAIGIGTISKYNFVLLPAAAAVAVFCDRQWRGRLFSPLVLISLVVSVAIVLPHGSWLLDNLGLATRGTITKMVEADAPHGIVRIVKAIVSLAAACLAFGAICLIALALAFRRSVASAARTGDRRTLLFGRIMLFSLAGVVLVILFAGTTKITERWLDPYLLVLPLYLLLKLEQTGADLARGLRKLLPFFLVVMVVTLLPAPIKTFSAGLSGSVGRINMPFADLARTIRQEGKPAVIFASGMHLAGNMRMQFPDVPVVNSDAPGKGLAEGGIRPPMLVIEIPPQGKPTDAPIDMTGVAGQGLTASPAITVELPYSFGGGKKMAFRYLWLR